MNDFVFQEGDLKIEFKSVFDARKFDDAGHGLSHCMKAVDFIVERSDCYLFIEFKDLQDPGIPAQNKHKVIQGFLRGMIDEDLKYKYRDSFLYEWAAGRADKPVDYLVLVGLDSLTARELVARTDDLKRKLPLQKSRSNPWARPFVRSCTVFNLASWNSNLPNFPVSRLTTSSQQSGAT